MKRKKRVGLIYAAINKSNEKVYIGQTIYSLDYRKKGHDADSKRGNSKFNNAIKKYTIDGFEWNILYKDIEEERLNEIEKLEIFLHDSCENGYNTTPGGDSNPMRGRKHSIYSKKKISESLSGRKHSKETLEKKRIAMLGKKASRETKDKISKNHADVSGKNNPMYGKNLYDYWRKKFDKKTAELKIKKHKKRLSSSLVGKMSGENNPTSKLTQEIVNNIRELYENKKLTLGQLSKKYNVTKSNICLIVNYKTWNRK